jgi:RNA polymerase sigma-70 factor (ECF subfamily)
LRGIQLALRRYLLRLVGTGSADDVLQEVLFLISCKLKWLDVPEAFRPWAYRIASREAFRQLRKEKRRSEQVRDEALLEDVPAAESVVPPELLPELLNSEALSPASRAVLALHFQEELPLAEIAAILEIPLGTVKSRLSYGLAALRRKLDPTRSV